MLRRAFASIPAGWIGAVDIPVTFDLLDPMEVVYHGAYPKFLEAARSNLLGRIGWGYREMREAGYAFPVVDMSIRYAEPARFEDLLEVRAGILAYSPKLTIVYEIRRKASRTQAGAAKSISATQRPSSPSRVNRPVRWFHLLLLVPRRSR